MPKRSWKKMLLNNLTSRSRNLSQEQLEEHRHQTGQDSYTSDNEDSFQGYCYENNQVSARPIRAAKVRCLQILTDITRSERSYDLDVSRERAAQRIANENTEQRERRLRDLRQRAAHRVATENNEQRERRLQDLRQRAAHRIKETKKYQAKLGHPDPAEELASSPANIEGNIETEAIDKKDLKTESETDDELHEYTIFNEYINYYDDNCNIGKYIEGNIENEAIDNKQLKTESKTDDELHEYNVFQ